MNNKALTLSLVMAVLAVFMVQSYVNSIEEETKKRFGTEVLVLTAKQDIKEMESLNETLFKLERRPKRFLEPSAVFFEKADQDKETEKSLRALTGAVALVPIKKGEQITYNKMVEPGIRTGLAPQITPGRRAIPISVNEISGVAKLVKPGDRVDVVAIIDLGGGKENKIAKTILQDVVILATGRNINNNVPRVVETDSTSGISKIRSLAEDPNFSSVTLEVDPLQAQMLALVQANGDTALSISLRNNDDTDRINIGSTTYGDVLGQDSARIQRKVAGH